MVTNDRAGPRVPLCRIKSSLGWCPILPQTPRQAYVTGCILSAFVSKSPREIPSVLSLCSFPPQCLTSKPRPLACVSHRTLLVVVCRPVYLTRLWLPQTLISKPWLTAKAASTFLQDHRQQLTQVAHSSLSSGAGYNGLPLPSLLCLTSFWEWAPFKKSSQ